MTDLEKAEERVQIAEAIASATDEIAKAVSRATPAQMSAAMAQITREAAPGSKGNSKSIWNKSNIQQLEELVGLIRMKMLQNEESEERNETIQCGNLTLNLSRIEATIDDQIIPISVLEFNLLRYFIENRNRVIERKSILDGVWKNAGVSTRNVDTHMHSLRKKLVGFDHSFKTVYAAGYILKSPVEKVTKP